MTQIRPATLRDQDALYDIVLKTGLSGADAAPLYDDPQMLGHIYTAPYLTLAPDLVFVAEVDGQVAGYVCGVVDTRAFEAALETRWWPTLRTRYVAPDPARREEWTEDEARADWIHHPQATPAYVAASFPAHMHMNLMPQARGTGVGRRLFDCWLTAARRQGAYSVHIGANPQNSGGIAFWAAMGFERLRAPDGHQDEATCWMGRV